MHDIFRIRRATVQDVEIIAWHRARMFQDMGDVSDDGFEILRTKARLRLKEWLESGDYIGWLAAPADSPESVVGGAGVQLQPILPRPLDASTIGEGRQGTIVNVFTEPQWRRRGIAGRLVKQIITWSKNEQIDRLLLHASSDGRSLYERLGSSRATKCISSAVSWTRATKESHLQPESERTLDLSRIAVPADELRLYHCGSCFPRSRRRQATAVRSRPS